MRSASLSVQHLLDPFRSQVEQRIEVFRALEASGGDRNTFQWSITQRVDLPGNPLQLTVTAFAKEPLDDPSPLV